MINESHGDIQYCWVCGIAMLSNQSVDIQQEKLTKTWFSEKRDTTKQKK